MTASTPPDAPASPGPAGSAQPDAAATPESAGSAQPAPPGAVMRWILSLPTWLYRAHLGVLLGHRFLLLVHVGRTTGRRRETVVEVIRYDPARRESIVLAGWGHRAQWLKNVEAGGAREIHTGRAVFVPSFRILPVEEGAAALADYERRNRIIAPIVRAVLSRLVGWRYDGSTTARRRVVRQLSVVGFRPAE